MTVYVIAGYMEYDGSEILAARSTPELARQFVAELGITQWDYLEVTALPLDGGDPIAESYFAWDRESQQNTQRKEGFWHNLPDIEGTE